MDKTNSEDNINSLEDLNKYLEEFKTTTEKDIDKLLNINFTSKITEIPFQYSYDQAPGANEIAEKKEKEIAEEKEKNNLIKENIKKIEKDNVKPNYDKFSKIKTHMKQLNEKNSNIYNIFKKDTECDELITEIIQNKKKYDSQYKEDYTMWLNDMIRENVKKDTDVEQISYIVIKYNEFKNNLEKMNNYSKIKNSDQDYINEAKCKKKEDIYSKNYNIIYQIIKKIDKILPLYKELLEEVDNTNQSGGKHKSRRNQKKKKMNIKNNGRRKSKRKYVM
jgi:hypothetical protein